MMGLIDPVDLTYFFTSLNVSAYVGLFFVSSSPSSAPACFADLKIEDAACIIVCIVEC